MRHVGQNETGRDWHIVGAEKGLRDLGPKETKSDLYFRKKFEKRVERMGRWGRGETKVRDQGGSNYKHPVERR